MHSTELIIMSVYLLVLMPAVIGPLIWAAVLDRRYREIYVRGAAQRSMRRAKHAARTRAFATEMHGSLA